MSIFLCHTHRVFHSSSRKKICKKHFAPNNIGIFYFQVNPADLNESIAAYLASLKMSSNESKASESGSDPTEPEGVDPFGLDAHSGSTSSDQLSNALKLSGIIPGVTSKDQKHLTTTEDTALAPQSKEATNYISESVNLFSCSVNSFLTD